MKAALDGEENPHDANIKKVLPSLVQWHTVNQRGLLELGGKLETFAGDVKGMIGQLKEEWQDSRRASEQRLATSFVQMAKSTWSGDGGSVTGMEVEPEGGEQEDGNTTFLTGDMQTFSATTTTEDVVVPANHPHHSSF